MPVFVIHRPPTNGALTGFRHNFAEVPCDVMPLHPNTIYTGDSNIPSNKPSNINNRAVTEVINSFSLKQIVPFPTQKSGNTLDLILFEETCVFHPSQIVSGDFISDHCFVDCTLDQVKDRQTIPRRSRVTFRKLKDVDTRSLRSVYSILSMI